MVTCSRAGCGGTWLAASSTASTQLVNSLRERRRVAPRTSANSAWAPSSSRKTASSRTPAASRAIGPARPVVCSSARRSTSQAASGRGGPKRARAAATSATSGASAAALASRLSSMHRRSTSRQSRRPWRRSQASSARRLGSPPQAGMFLRASSTSSLLAFQVMARNRAINCAATRVVESFQPFSSRMATPRAPSSARTRRVSARSVAARATGTRPASMCASTRAAARSASSSVSTAGNRRTSPRGPSAGSTRVSARSPQRAARALVSGSGWKPCSTKTASTVSSACALKSTSVACAEVAAQTSASRAMATSKANGPVSAPASRGVISVAQARRSSGARAAASAASCVADSTRPAARTSRCAPRPARSSRLLATGRSRAGSKLRSSGPGLNGASCRAQLRVVSKRGAKPSGKVAAHWRAATGMSWA